MRGTGKPVVHIKNWCMDKWREVLMGDVYGHPRFHDGTTVSTSTIQNIMMTEDRWIIETRNTFYICMLEDRKE